MLCTLSKNHFFILIFIITTLSTNAALSSPIDLGALAYKKGDYFAAKIAWEDPSIHEDPDAAYNLGQLYRLGQGVKKDLKKAKDHYLIAATKGHLMAQRHLGTLLYFVGQGVKKDLKKAKDHYLIAATKGHLMAQRHLGTLLYFGVDGLRQYKSAFDWLYKAAMRQDTQSQWMISTMFFNGEGIPKDIIQAYVWLSIAADNKHKTAEQNKPEMRAQLSPEQLTSAETKIKQIYNQWTQQPLKIKTIKNPTPHYKIQVGSFSSNKAAEKAQKTIKNKFSDLLENQPSEIIKTDASSNKKIIYKLKFGNFKEKDDAKNLCNELKIKGLSCFINS